ncbi:hypothetical protein GH714_032937 [Hevea brasiliensis]|uniref:Uncharacterized protein n=1 Tax=Hevea brasiliensis TaxID=3981 RepID=A0A6A6LWX4_HEVBR|nr:hypothetical protein GH714_032937 [Hevea brasiliensis]
MLEIIERWEKKIEISEKSVQEETKFQGFENGSNGGELGLLIQGGKVHEGQAGKTDLWQSKTNVHFSITKTISELNRRREQDLSLWCEEMYTVDHICNKEPMWVTIINDVEDEEVIVDFEFNEEDGKNDDVIDDFTRGSVEALAKHVDDGHKASCPWEVPCCVSSNILGLLQFQLLPTIAASIVEQMWVSRGPMVGCNFTFGERDFMSEAIKCGGSIRVRYGNN